MTTLDVEPLTGALGAEVRGVDLNRLDDATWNAIYELWLDNLVLFFPDQDLTPDAHVEFARRFGEPEIHPFLPKYDDDHPEVVVLTNEGGNIADIWHTDVTFEGIPPKASILTCSTG